ncbi:hypothetical protein [Hymenobacter crusticola]|uniref:Uncharacterized protein n=1 Tax=Hymenobacter crusticola TaxID=1770526 RepID=A0A243W7S0_9BACT|nr:hypothetical protein [Hymenobacter crusticola]OUJ68611.1 hypothetical protein BXP70_27835 [Hymenobacter crusticola]
MLKTLDFPVKPHVAKYLLTHLGVNPYVLSNSDRFGKMLFHLLRRQLKGRLFHATSREECTAVLQLDMCNFPVHQYGLTELTNYTVYQFNDFVDELLKEELYIWIRKFVNRTTTRRDVIVDFMAAYDLREEDIQYETLRKAVQRNVKLKNYKKKGAKTVGKMSQKNDGLSRKSGEVSRDFDGLSRHAQVIAMRQSLTKESMAQLAF